jgi:hypothetical protein
LGVCHPDNSGHCEWACLCASAGGKMRNKVEGLLIGLAIVAAAFALWVLFW